MPNNFTKNIKTLRQNKGLTQEKLGNDIMSSQKNIAAYEAGRAHPGYDKLIDIADYFKVSIDQLLKDTI